MKMRWGMLAVPILCVLLGGSRGPSAPEERALSFEENRGQLPARVAYQARGSGYSVQLSRDALTVVSQRAAVRIHPRDRSLGRPVAEGALPGRVNYLLGSDPTCWWTGIPTWSRVRYRQIYPGVDLVCYGRQTRLEYDLHLGPGGDPGEICLAYEGARLALDGDGSLLVQVGQTRLVQPAPVAYQERAGQRLPVGVRYALKEGGLGFEVAAFDPSLGLVIDPLIYSSYLGGNSTDEILGVAVDGAGNAYLGGYTQSTNLPMTPGSFQPTHAGALTDGFVSKVSPTGSLIYTTYLGGSQKDEGVAIAVDSTGNAYLAGSTASPDFPLKNPLTSTVGGGFVCKLNATGTALQYSTMFLGNVSGIAVDGAGSAYVVGETTDRTTFPIFNPFQASYKGGTSDAFLTKLTPSGTAVTYSTYLGGSGLDAALAVAVDSSGQATVTGFTTSSDFPVKTPMQSTRAGKNECFVTRFTTFGNALVYSTYLGGSGDDIAHGVAVDGAGNAYVAGETESADLQTSQAFQPAPGGVRDGFLGKLTAPGGLGYLTYVGGSSNDDLAAVAADVNGNAMAVGRSGALDYPMKDALQSTPVGLGDAVFTRLSPTGTLLQSSFVGGKLTDFARCAAVGPTGTVYMAGTTGSVDFPTLSPFQAALAGGGADGFVTRLTPGDPSSSPSASPSPSGSPQSFSISLQTGWNAVGFRAGTVTAITANPAILRVASFNGASYELANLAPGSVNPTTRGYFLFAQSPTTLAYVGAEPASSGSIPLSQGWNLIAFPVSSSLPGSSLRTTRAGVSVPLTSVLLPQFYENRADGTQVPVDVSSGGTVVRGVNYWTFAGQSQVTLTY